jgi:hypothetical protein
MGTGGSFPGGKARPGRDADHSPPSSAEVKNEKKLYLLSPNMPPWRVAGQLYFFFLLYTLEVILFITKNDAAITNRQVHNHLTRNSSHHHQPPHNPEICNSRPAIAGCKLYNKLPAHIKLIRDDQLFKRKLKELLLKGCYYSIEEYVNDDFSHNVI